MSSDVVKRLEPTLHSGFLTQGERVEEFEKDLQEWFGYPYILTLNSATAGLTLALRMLNLQPGDEILACPFTCFAATVPILANNLSIKWVDVDPNTCNIDLDDLKRKITKKTKVALFVHWAGIPVDLDKLEKIKKYALETFSQPLHIIEDCAHAFGAEFAGQKLGTQGMNTCVFSLQAIKHLTTGDGGLIFLPDEESYNRTKLLRWYGIDRKQRSGKGKDFRLEADIGEWGYKFHMNDINASIGLANLPHIEKLLEIGRSNAAYYEDELRGVQGVVLLDNAKKANPSFWIYTFRVINKIGFIEFMKENDVMVSQVHNRNDVHSCIAEFRARLPALDSLVNEVVSIPCGWWVTDDDRARVVQLIKEWCDKFQTRLIEDGDYDKGFLDTLYYLSGRIHDLSQEEFSSKINEIRMNGGIVNVLEQDGKIVATGKLHVESKFYNDLGHIEDIVVHPDYRKRGFGTFMVRELADIAKQMGCYKTVLAAKESLEPFYNNTGFRTEGVGMALRH